MMEIWVKEYQKINPEIRIDVSGGGAGKGMTEALDDEENIRTVCRQGRKYSTIAHSTSVFVFVALIELAL